MSKNYQFFHMKIFFKGIWYRRSILGVLFCSLCLVISFFQAILVSPTTITTVILHLQMDTNLINVHLSEEYDSTTITSFTHLILFLSAPIVIYALENMRRIYLAYFQSDLLQIRNLKSLGKQNHDFLWQLGLESALLGAAAGIVGNLLGMVVSKFMIQSVFRIFIQDISPYAISRDLWLIFPFSFQNLALCITIGVSISLLAVFYGYFSNFNITESEIVSQTPQYLRLQQRKRKQKIVRQGLIVILLIGSFISVSFTSLSNWSFNTFLDNFLEFPWLSLMFGLMLVVSPLSPFIVFIVFFKLLQNLYDFITHSEVSQRLSLRQHLRKSRSYTTDENRQPRSEIKITNKLRSIFHQFKGRAYWAKILGTMHLFRNREKSKGLLISFSIILSLVLFANTLIQAEQGAIAKHELYLNGQSDGFLTFEPNSDFESISVLTANIGEHLSNLSLNRIAWQIFIQGDPSDSLIGGANNSSLQTLGRISMISINSYKEMAIPSSWCENGDSSEILDRLSQPNTALFPKELKNSYHLVDGQTLYWNCTDSQGIHIMIPLTVVGFYSCFPLSPLSYSPALDESFASTIIVGDNTSLPPSMRVSMAEFMLYYNEHKSDLNVEGKFIALCSMFYPEADFRTYSPLTRQFGFQQFSDSSYTAYKSAIDFCHVEFVYLVVYLGFGIIFQVYLYIEQRKHEFSLLKSTGASDSAIRQVLIWETSGIVALAAGSSLIGFLSSVLLANFFNMLFHTTVFFRRVPQLWLTSTWIVDLILASIFIASTLLFTTRKLREFDTGQNLVEELKITN